MKLDQAGVGLPQSIKPSSLGLKLVTISSPIRSSPSVWMLSEARVH